MGQTFRQGKDPQNQRQKDQTKAKQAPHRRHRKPPSPAIQAADQKQDQQSGHKPAQGSRPPPPVGQEGGQQGEGGGESLPGQDNPEPGEAVAHR